MRVGPNSRISIRNRSQGSDDALLYLIRNACGCPQFVIQEANTFEYFVFETNTSEYIGMLLRLA